MTTAGSAPSTPSKRRPARFALVGGAATVVDVGVVLLLVDPLGRLLADVVALVAAALVSRALHERVTLRGDTLDRWISRPSVFATVALVAGAVDLVVFLALGSLDPWAAKGLAVLAAASVRAIAHRAVLFRAVRLAQDQPAHRAPVEGGPRLSVVVPAYREEGRIAATVVTLRRELAAAAPGDQLELIVVDDGSGDATADEARSAGADTVVSYEPNRGKGAAVRAGVAIATGRTVAFTDADLAYPPRQLLRLLDEVEAGWDVVIGDRHHPETLTLRGQSSVRSFGSRLVNMATYVLLRGNYRDTQCGLKAFRRDVARTLFDSGTIVGFAFDIELLHLVERYGLSLREVPVEVVNSETSTVRAVRDGFNVARDILLIRHRSRTGGYPRISEHGLPPAGSVGPEYDLDHQEPG